MPGVSTNRIAGALATRAASVTDMLRRLADKGLLNYEKYRGVQLTAEGQRLLCSPSASTDSGRCFWCSSWASIGTKCTK